MAEDKDRDHQKALSFFEQALKNDPNNPNILNMLEHSQLKLGYIDESILTYKKALELRVRFPEAREYLGEAYVQAALREIATLKSYGKDGEESLEDLENAIREAAKGLK
jgi:tetratricopeptide (TPR) repeat protein